jgi:2-oxoglutarate/2-oxoacid ferredoxin oxidoreductase subunit alpha
MTLSAVNDFVVKFANVNGSGSASANGMFAKSILRMGVPVAARNIFPSNIQGLPTWYEVRISEAGHLGRRGGVDLMVAMNPQTWDQDVASIEPGGYLFYDSTKPLPPSKFRADIEVLGLPLTAICNAAYTDPRQRQLFKNIIYVGALAYLLGIEEQVLETLVREEFGSKANLIDANLRALGLGRDEAAKLLAPIGLRMQRADKVGDRIYVEGNTAAALGAVYGGATVCAWYPITPSTSLAEAFTAHCQRLRVDRATGEAKFAIIQAEDEIASIGIVIGAGWNGARSFTCTSGPGISLMQEFVGLSYFAEIPAVIFDVQRGGPSTGMPTRTQQSDILLAAYASHGDTKHPLLFPEDPAECFEFGALAFDLADRLQTTIFVMLDLDIGMNEWLCRPFQWDDSRRLDRGKVMTYAELEAGKDFGRYLDVDGDGIAYRTLPGVHPERGAYFTRGTSRDPYARYSEEGSVYVANMQRLLEKFETAKSLIPAPIARPAKRRTPHGVIYFGSTTPAMHESLELLEAQGEHVDGLRVRGFPFSDEVMDFIAAHETVFVVEQNRDAQLRTLVMVEGGVDPSKLVSVLGYDGSPITARFITDEISRRIRGLARTPTPLVAE